MTTRANEGTSSVWIWAALVLAGAGVAGSLSLSLVLELKACPLCFYQRTFALAVVSVLGMAVLFARELSARLNLLALPLALGGLGVAGFHVWLELTGRLECPAGLLGLGSAPVQSLGLFLGLTALLIGGVLHGWQSGSRTAAGLTAALLLGGLLAAASTVANPPLPKPPAAPYPSARPDVCRPPYQAGVQALACFRTR
jgi:disulfide bond formation protein DsbB